MPSIKVKLGDRSYQIEIAPGALGDTGGLARQVLGQQRRTAVLITNSKVDALHGPTVVRSLSRAGFRVLTCRIPDGERFKTIRTAETLHTFLIENRIERSDFIVALGGGVVGDVAGFVAATYLRGIRVVQIPTTLLAQLDSSVGGKTGVNHKLGKNLIGAFHQPSLVVIDPDVLGSLAPREFRSGLYEALKYGVIRDRALFERLLARMTAIQGHDPEELTHLITTSCRIKAFVVNADERESGLRKILNFGHTVGHAIEAATAYRRYRHGEAVGLGMRAAGRLAQRMGMFAPVDADLLSEAVERVGRIPAPVNLAPDVIIEAIKRDKKSEAGRVTFVLPTAIGKVELRADVPVRSLKSALREILV